MVLLRDDLMCKRCGRDALGRPSTSDTGFGGGVGADISGTGVNSTAESSDTFCSLGAGGALMQVLPQAGLRDRLMAKVDGENQQLAERIYGFFHRSAAGA